MTNQNQSKSDERNRKLNECCAQLQVEATQLKQETEKLDKKTDERWEKTLKGFKETRKGLKDTRKGLKDTKKIINEVSEMQKENAKQLKETRRQIGGLGNKFGGYTEAMAMPSIKRMLDERFDADFKGSNLVRNTNNGLDMEVDAWGVSRNGTGAAYIVEIKSKFRDKHIKQVWQLVERFRIHQSEYRARAVYPMLAVVDISDEGRAMVWNAGIHLIEIDDGVFQYAKPPKDFEADGYRGMRGVRKDVPHLRAVPGGDQNLRGTG